MVALIKALQVILALSLLIFIHELGHFMWAKIFRIRVEKFYLFFDIGGKALFRFKKGETEFGIGWLPLGGYCKISGMIDESMDLEQMKREPQPWEFRTHPARERLMVMAGGVINNFILAILIYIAMMAIWGDTFIRNQGSRIYVSELAYDMGFRNGDEILRFDDYEPQDFSMLQADLARRDVSVATIKRGADTLDLYIDHAMLGDVLNTPYMFDLAIPFVIEEVSEDGPNAGGSLMPGDRIIEFDGQSVEFVQDSRIVLETLKDREIAATAIRGADTLHTAVKVDTLGRIGVSLVRPGIEHRNYNIIQAIPAGWRMTCETIGGYLRDLKLLATPSSGAYKSVGSFIAIGEVFPSAWDSHQFMYLLALLSIMLGVMNLIPIPGLDGGHILFTLYEMLTGRKPSEKLLFIAQLIGMALLLGLMFLAFGNDIGRLIN